MHAPQPVPTEIIHPDDDGLPMSDNTIQFEWIQRLKGNLDILFRDRDDVFVAGNLLWYPVEGNPGIRRAPDAMVAFGRPRGDRGSYRQWVEGGVPLTVVFEVRSPNDGDELMQEKLEFYERYRVEEYYLIDPQENTLAAYRRRGRTLRSLPVTPTYTSPRLGIRFDLTGTEVELFLPNKRPFLSLVEIDQQREVAVREAKSSQRKERAERKLRIEAEQQTQEAEKRSQQAEQQRQQAEQQRQRAEQRTARIALLTRRVLGGQATSDERAELDRILADGA